MQQNAASSPFSAYADRPQLGLDVEFGADPASGAAFFQSDGRKNEDLKQMLDSNKDGLKLEAMKRIIGMIARGRDASNLFPAVVKNVVSKNIEVKKLVYVYLVRYAEEQQDLALLSISTFQRALKDPNQLIRASALRVLSSIRVSMIVPIVMLAIRESAADLSPYVRKTAAHAIPKLYSLDPEQKDELVTVIEKLLSDRTTLVVGSAVMAFDEVCPERVDLIHKNYRKLCNLLVDVDEWGQVIIINMLTRYARTQFEDPNADEAVNEHVEQQGAVGDNVPFYNDTSSAESDTSDARQLSTNKTNNNNTNNNNNASSNNGSSSNNNNKTREPTGGNDRRSKRRSSTPSASNYTVDLDHRLLLRQTKPLLQSRNASVVMAVAQLYHHVAPRNEVLIIAKALIRLLRSHKEVQSVVLTCIASMSTKRKGIFEPHLKSFFVRTSDPTHIKLLKLDILTNLASAASIALILREFQTYISSSDRPFVAATIQAIGRCAASISEVTETCLSGLVHLLSNRDEHVVAESVVVIKKLLQTKAAEHFEIITQMAKLIDFITVPAARAAIIWLIGEYNEKVPKIAPDVLRKMAKTFIDEEDIVKLQVLNLGVKLYLTNPEQTSLLCQYVFTLARYDTNYDVRDRARFLRQFIFPGNGSSTILSQSARKVFLATKPAPAPESKYRDSNNYQLGSLSHYLNMRATGYKELPSFPEIAPDSSVRNIEGFMHETGGDGTPNAGGEGDAADGVASSSKKHASKKEKGFLSESEENSSPYSATSSSSSSSDSDSSSESSTSSEDETGNDQEQQQQQKAKTGQQQQQQQKKALKVMSKLNSSSGKATSSGGLANQSSAPLLVMETNSNNNNNNNNVNVNSNVSGNSQAKNPNDSGTSDSESSSYSSDGSTSNSSGSDNSESDNDNDNDENEAGIAVDAALSSSSSSDDNKKKFKKKKHVRSSKTKLNSVASPPPSPQPSSSTAAATTLATATKSNLDLLLDLDDIPPIGPVMTPSLGGFLTPGTPSALLAGGSGAGIALQPQQFANRIELVGPSYIEFKHKELLNKLSGHGLQLGYRFTRSPHLYSSSMTSIELQFVNRASDEITGIQLGRQSTLPAGMHLNEFAPIQQLQPLQTATSILGVDFNDSTHAIDLEICSSVGTSRVTLKPPIGELVRAVQISEACFKEERTKLRGMNEHQSHLTLPSSSSSSELVSLLKQKVFECVNVAYIPGLATTTTTTPLPAATGFSEHSLNFAGQTLSSKSFVLIVVSTTSDDTALKLAVTVNCEKMVVGSMVLNELRNTLQAHFNV